MLPERVRGFVSTLALLIVATVILALIWPAYVYVREESFLTSAALNISVGYRASAIVAGLALMFVIAVGHAIRESTACAARRRRRGASLPPASSCGCCRPA